MEIFSKFRTKPQNFLNYLLNVKHKNGLYDILRSHGYINYLKSEEYLALSDFSLYKIEIHLTEHGLENLKEVMQILF